VLNRWGNTISTALGVGWLLGGSAALDGTTLGLAEAVVQVGFRARPNSDCGTLVEFGSAYLGHGATLSASCVEAQTRSALLTK